MKIFHGYNVENYCCLLTNWRNASLLVSVQSSRLVQCLSQVKFTLSVVCHLDEPCFYSALTIVTLVKTGKKPWICTFWYPNETSDNFEYSGGSYKLMALAVQKLWALKNYGFSQKPAISAYIHSIQCIACIWSYTVYSLTLR